MMAESGLTVLEVLEHVWHIGDPWGVWATLIEGNDGALLVDTGTGIGDLAGVVHALTAKPLTVVNTHGHADHIGGNDQFPRVFLPPADLPYARLARSSAVKNGVCRVAAERGAAMSETRRQAFLRADLSNVLPLKADAVFELGGRTVRAVPLPGHTPGSTGFWCPELKLLLSGDAIAPMIYLFFPESCTAAEYARLLERVREEIPFERLLSGHSDRLIPREELEVYRECALSLDPARGRPFRDPLFPEYEGAMYVHESIRHPGEYAILVYSPEKERGGTSCGA